LREFTNSRVSGVIPRVAGSGQSFRGAGQYYLNDKLSHEADNAFNSIGDYALHDKENRSTANRVGFTAILNMEALTPEEAIEQMTSSFERYREREANKRGRKLTKPVYAYSLSWAPDQKPDREEMLSAAHSSLKALRLENLQTLIVQHTDEPQPHIHIIVNRIERDGSRARNIPFDQLRFSKWAEEYERSHGGILCERRVTNNEKRREGHFVKDTVSLTRAQYEARERQRHREPGLVSEQRKDAFKEHGAQINALWSRQAKERDKLLAATQGRIKNEAALLDKRFASNWTRLYNGQAKRSMELSWANKVGIFERACFLFRHRDLLKSTGRLRMRDIVRLCLSRKAMRKRLDSAHQVERRDYGHWIRAQKQKAVSIAWTQHREDSVAMVMRHNLERDGLRYLQLLEHELLQVMPQVEGQLAPEPVKTLDIPALSNGENYAPDALQEFLKDPPKTKFKRAPDPANNRRPKPGKYRDRGVDFEPD
jgi:hypothetical protein